MVSMGSLGSTKDMTVLVPAEGGSGGVQFGASSAGLNSDERSSFRSPEEEAAGSSKQASNQLSSRVPSVRFDEQSIREDSERAALEGDEQSMSQRDMSQREDSLGEGSSGRSMSRGRASSPGNARSSPSPLKRAHSSFKASSKAMSGSTFNLFDDPAITAALAAKAAEKGASKGSSPKSRSPVPPAAVASVSARTDAAEDTPEEAAPPAEQAVEVDVPMVEVVIKTTEKSP